MVVAAPNLRVSVLSAPDFINNLFRSRALALLVHGPAPRCAGSYEDMPCQTVVTSVLSPGEARELVNAIAADAREAIDDMHEVEKASKPGPHQPD
jgi:hypothetical protein